MLPSIFSRLAATQPRPPPRQMRGASTSFKSYGHFRHLNSLGGLDEMDANRFCRAPNDTTSAFPHFGFNDEREFAGDTDWIDDQQRSGFRHVTNDAIERRSGPKNNQSAFQRTIPRTGTMLAQSSTPIIPDPVAATFSMARLETMTSSLREDKCHQKGSERMALGPSGGPDR